MHLRRPAFLAAATTMVLGLVASPAAAQEQPVYEIDQEQVDALVAGIEAPGVETVSGELGGAAYVGQKPDDWNGDLVVWAHGYRGEGTAGVTGLTVDPPPVREWLLEQGYAWVASSYRRNSYDPGIGVRDTRNATWKAQALFGRADETYLAGVSMGGHVTASAIEQNPWLYDGALPTCGVLGDVELFDYFLDYNLGAAAFADVEVEYPDPQWIGDEVAEIKAVLSNGPRSTWAASGTPLAGGQTALTATGEAFKDFVEVGSGGERGAIFDFGWDYWHLLASPTGNFFFSLGEGDGTVGDVPGILSQNSDVEYAQEYAGVDGGIDDEVVRVTAEPSLREPVDNYFKRAPVIEGLPPVPVLTMHTIGDLFVPIEMEQVYAREVADNGRSDLLVQRAIRDVGHCTFSDSEWQQAFGDLFAWVEDGTRPEGDDLVADISDPTLGCEWTISDGTAAAGGGVRAFDC